MAIDCPSDTVGSIDIDVTGGVGPFEFSIDNGVTFGDESVLSNLPAGNYTINIIDSEECPLDTTATINSSVEISPPLFGIEFCFGDPIPFQSGNDFVQLSQGTVTQWEWDFGEGADIPTANTAGPHEITYNRLGIPEVTLTVTLDNNCEFTIDVNGAANPFSSSIAACCCLLYTSPSPRDRG